MVHVNVSMVAGQGFKNRYERVHICELTNKTEINQKIVLVVAGAHTLNIAGITSKPPPRFEAFDRFNVLEGLHPRGEIELIVHRLTGEVRRLHRANEIRRLCRRAAGKRQGLVASIV